MASAALSTRVFRAGRVLAPDSKWTGEEPEWKGWETWSTEKFFKTRLRMLNFYGYYLVSADLKPQVLSYMKAVGYSKGDVDAISSANANFLPTTVGKLVRAMDRGMPPIHPQAQEYFDKLPFSDPENPPIAKDDRDIIKAEIHACLAHIRSLEKNQKVDEEEKVVVPTPTIADRLRAKVDREVIYYLDEMLDKWSLSSHMTRVDGLSMASFIRDGKIPPAGCAPIVKWIERQRDEYQGALDKTCPQLVEGYEHMSKPALKNRIATLETMLADVLKHSTVAKGARKVRVKKVKDAAKQIVRLQYQVEAPEYKIKSIDPLRLPASQRAYVFNTKYRTLSIYVATGGAGFEVKGTSLKGFDTVNSFTITLRKPQEVLDTIMACTPKQIEKYLDALKSKKRIPNGRINPQTILLRTDVNR
jgi:hypothetical protein